MITSLKRAFVCLLTAWLLGLGIYAPAIAESDTVTEDQQEVVELVGGADEAPPCSATTTVTAYIEAEPAPNEPEQPTSPNENTGNLPGTGDPGAGWAYVLLLSSAGVFALRRIVVARS